MGPAVNPRMRPADLAHNQSFAIVNAPPAAEHLSDAPVTELLCRRLGTIRSAVPLALAVPVSAERLPPDFALQVKNGLVVVRGATVVIELKAIADNLTLAGSSDWFIGQPEQPSV